MKGTVLIIVGLVLAASFLAGCSNENVAGEASTPVSRIINANACNADESCEANSINVQHELNAQRIAVSNALSAGYVVVGTPSDNPAEEGDILVAGDIITDGTISTHGIDTIGPVNAQRIAVSDMLRAGSFMSTSLAGEGNAYACIDAEGVIFRSSKPCS